MLVVSAHFGDCFRLLTCIDAVLEPLLRTKL